MDSDTIIPANQFTALRYAFAAAALIASIAVVVVADPVPSANAADTPTVEVRSLRNLADGDTVYVAPWAFHDDETGCWLDVDYVAQTAPSDRVSMQVTGSADGYVLTDADPRFVVAPTAPQTGMNRGRVASVSGESC